MGYRYMRFPGGKPKAVTFSFDDGFWFDVPVSEKLSNADMKATFNITGSYLEHKRNNPPDLGVVKGKAYNELPITKDEIVFWIKRFRDLNTNNLSHRRRLIDSFINSHPYIDL